MAPRKQSPVNVIFATDNNYLPYLAVTLQSLVEHISDRKYIINILLSEPVADYRINALRGRVPQNVELNFIDISDRLAQYGLDLFFTHFHFSIAVYLRIFAPDIFTDLNRALYCDCDLIFRRDIAELFDMDIGDNLAGAVRDYGVKIDALLNEQSARYYTETLHMDNIEDYFNSGVLLMNLAKMREFNLTAKSLDKLREIGRPKYVDQCVLNSVCNGRIHYFDMKWNTQNHIGFYIDDNTREIPDTIVKEYDDAVKNGYIMHYTSGAKPWRDPALINANLWWEYARKTPFYTEIIYRNYAAKMGSASPLRDAFRINKLRRRRARYRLLSHITTGKIHRKYRDKKNALSDRIHAVYKYLNGKI